MNTATASGGHSVAASRLALRATMAWLLGLLVAVGLGIATSALGLSLSSYDQQRQHIPGHVLYNALIIAPALVQLVYLVPLYRAARRREHRGFAWGLCVGASLVALANGALLWLSYVFSQMD